MSRWNPQLEGDDKESLTVSEEGLYRVTATTQPQGLTATSNETLVTFEEDPEITITVKPTYRIEQHDTLIIQPAFSHKEGLLEEDFQFSWFEKVSETDEKDLNLGTLNFTVPSSEIGEKTYFLKVFYKSSVVSSELISVTITPALDFVIGELDNKTVVPGESITLSPQVTYNKDGLITGPTFTWWEADTDQKDNPRVIGGTAESLLVKSETPAVRYIFLVAEVNGRTYTTNVVRLQWRKAFNASVILTSSFIEDDVIKLEQNDLQTTGDIKLTIHDNYDYQVKSIKWFSDTTLVKELAGHHLEDTLTIPYMITKQWELKAIVQFEEGQELISQAIQVLVYSKFIDSVTLINMAEKTYEGDRLVIKYQSDAPPDHTPHSYQWYKDNTPLDNQTASTLTIEKATLEDTGTYQLDITYLPFYQRALNTGTYFEVFPLPTTLHFEPSTQSETMTFYRHQLTPITIQHSAVTNKKSEDIRYQWQWFDNTSQSWKNVIPSSQLQAENHQLIIHNAIPEGTRYRLQASLGELIIVSPETEVKYMYTPQPFYIFDKSYEKVQTGDTATVKITPFMEPGFEGTITKREWLYKGNVIGEGETLTVGPVYQVGLRNYYLRTTYEEYAEPFISPPAKIDIYTDDIDSGDITIALVDPLYSEENPKFTIKATVKTQMTGEIRYEWYKISDAAETKIENTDNQFAISEDNLTLTVTAKDDKSHEGLYCLRLFGMTNWHRDQVERSNELYLSGTGKPGLIFEVFNENKVSTNGYQNSIDFELPYRLTNGAVVKDFEWTFNDEIIYPLPPDPVGDALDMSDPKNWDYLHPTTLKIAGGAHKNTLSFYAVTEDNVGSYVLSIGIEGDDTRFTAPAINLTANMKQKYEQILFTPVQSTEGFSLKVGQTTQATLSAYDRYATSPLMFYWQYRAMDNPEAQWMFLKKTWEDQSTPATLPITITDENLHYEYRGMVFIPSEGSIPIALPDPYSDEMNELSGWPFYSAPFRFDRSLEDTSYHFSPVKSSNGFELTVGQKTTLSSIVTTTEGGLPPGLVWCYRPRSTPNADWTEIREGDEYVNPLTDRMDVTITEANKDYEFCLKAGLNIADNPENGEVKIEEGAGGYSNSVTLTALVVPKPMITFLNLNQVLTATVGDAVTIDYSYSLMNGAEIELIQYFLRNGENTDAIEIDSSKIIAGNYDITSVTLEQMGNYSAKVKLKGIDDVEDYPIATLTVNKIVPVIEITTTEQTVEETEEGTITLVSDFTITPFGTVNVVKWFKDDTQIESPEITNTDNLQLSALTKEKAGRYHFTVEADNAETKTSPIITVVVKDKPIPQLEASFDIQETYTQFVGETLEVKPTNVVITPEEHKSLGAFTWYKGDTEVTTGDTLSFTALELTQAGEYRLVFKQGDREVVSKTFNVVVKQHPTLQIDSVGDRKGVINKQHTTSFLLTVSHAEISDVTVTARYRKSDEDGWTNAEHVLVDNLIIVDLPVTDTPATYVVEVNASLDEVTASGSVNFKMFRPETLTLTYPDPREIDAYFGEEVTLRVIPATTVEDPVYESQWLVREGKDSWNTVAENTNVYTFTVAPSRPGWTNDEFKFYTTVKTADGETIAVQSETFTVNYKEAGIHLRYPENVLSDGSPLTLTEGQDFEFKIVATLVPATGLEETIFKWVKVTRDELGIESKETLDNTTDTLTLPNLTEDHSGQYYAEVTIGKYTKTSVTLPITVQTLPNPIITITPVGETTHVSNLLSLVSFNTDVNHEPSHYPISYQWVLLNEDNLITLTDGAVFTGTTTQKLSITPADKADFGEYKLVVTAKVGQRTVQKVSEVFTLNEAPPALDVITISQQPVSRYLTVGDMTDLTVFASSTFGATLSYRWEYQQDMQLNWTPIEESEVVTGTDTSRLIFNAVSLAQLGKYRVVVSNENTTVTSEEVSLNIQPVEVPIEFDLKIEGIQETYYLDEPFLIQATLSDRSLSATYQWYKDEQPIENVTDRLDVLTAKETDSGTYTVKVTAGSVVKTSSPIVIEVIAKPIVEIPLTLVMEQTHYRVLEGNDFVMKGTAFTPEDATLQWYKKINQKFEPIKGATYLEFPVTNPNASTAGEFSLVVTHGERSLRSESIFLVVDVPSVIVDPELPEIIDNGDDKIDEGEFDFSTYPEVIRKPLDIIREYCIRMSPERNMTKEQMMEWQVLLYGAFMDIFALEEDYHFYTALAHVPTVMGRVKRTVFSVKNRGRYLANISDILLNDDKKLALLHLMDLFTRLSDIETTRSLPTSWSIKSLEDNMSMKAYIRLNEYVQRKIKASRNLNGRFIPFDEVPMTALVAATLIEQ